MEEGVLVGAGIWTRDAGIDFDVGPAAVGLAVTVDQAVGIAEAAVGDVVVRAESAHVRAGVSGTYVAVVTIPTGVTAAGQ